MKYKIITYLFLTSFAVFSCAVMGTSFQSQSQIQEMAQLSQTSPVDLAALIGVVQSLLQQGHSVNEVVACVQKTFDLEHDAVELVQIIGTLSQEGFSVPQIIARLNNESSEREQVEVATYKTLWLLGACVIVIGVALYYVWWRSNNNFVVNGQPIHSAQELDAVLGNVHNESCEQLVARFMQDTREARFETCAAADDAFNQLIERLNAQGHNFSAEDGIIRISNAFPTWRDFDSFWQNPENRRFS